MKLAPTREGCGVPKAMGAAPVAWRGPKYGSVVSFYFFARDTSLNARFAACCRSLGTYASRRVLIESPAHILASGHDIEEGAAVKGNALIATWPQLILSHRFWPSDQESFQSIHSRSGHCHPPSEQFLQEAQDQRSPLRRPQD